MIEEEDEEESECEEMKSTKAEANSPKDHLSIQFSESLDLNGEDIDPNDEVK